MKEHRDKFLESLTEEEYAIHKKEVDKGTIEKAMAVLKKKDPKKAAENLEKESEIDEDDNGTS